MEIIKIGDDAYKVSLNSQETQDYDINTIDQYNREEMSIRIRSLLGKLKNDGIDFGKEKVSAEVFLSKDGGCEIFLSKITSSQKATRMNAKPLSRVTYRFLNLKDLLMACNILKSYDYDGISSVHHNQEKGSYYLALTGVYLKDNKYAFLGEFGEKVKESMLPYIKEYCKCICESNVVEVFSKLL